MVAGLVSLLVVPAQAMIPHAMDYLIVRAPGQSVVPPANDRLAGSPGENGAEPSLAAWYTDGKLGGTGQGINNIAYDVNPDGNPDTHPRDPIPEPATMILLGSGLLAGRLAARRRRIS